MPRVMMGRLGQDETDALTVYAQSGAEVPGTGMSVSDLQAAGLSNDDIMGLINQGDVPTPGAGVVLGPPAPGQPGSSVATPAGTTSPIQIVLPSNTVSASGQLPPGPAPRVAATPTAAPNFFTGATLVAGVPNAIVLGGLAAMLMIIPGMFGPKRR